MLCRIGLGCIGLGLVGLGLGCIVLCLVGFGYFELS